MSDTLKIDGLNDAIQSLGQFVDDIDGVVHSSVDEVLTTIEKEMVSKASGRFNKYAEGVLLNSISHVTSKKENGIFGSVGVYDMSNKTGSNDRRLTSPIIADFLQKGVQPHSLVSGVRAPKRGTPKNLVDQYNVESKSSNPNLWHPGFEGYEFIRISFDSNVSKIDDITIRNLDKAAKIL